VRWFQQQVLLLPFCHHNHNHSLYAQTFHYLQVLLLQPYPVQCVCDQRYEQTLCRLLTSRYDVPALHYVHCHPG
jgi:hypothetical protein